MLHANSRQRATYMYAVLRSVVQSIFFAAINFCKQIKLWDY